MKKFLDSQFVGDSSLGARQIRVVASTAAVDRDGDIVEPRGCKLDNYRKNPAVLASHDPKLPIGTAKIFVFSDRIEALITFAPAGSSATADEYCALAKAGALNAVSIGFRVIEREPNRETGGFRFTSWELLEISVVAIPSNPEALVVSRGFKAGRVLSGENATALAAVQRCLDKSEDAHREAVALLKTADRHRARAAEHASAIAQSAETDGCDDDDADEELSLGLARFRRRRLIDETSRNSDLPRIRHPNAIEANSDLARRRRQIDVLRLSLPR